MKNYFKKFVSILNRLDEAYEFRNLVAHSIWKKGKARTIIPIVIKAKGGTIKISASNLKEETISASRLVDEAEKIDRLQADFGEFFRSNFGFKFGLAPKKKGKK